MHKYLSLITSNTCIKECKDSCSLTQQEWLQNENFHHSFLHIVIFAIVQVGQLQLESACLHSQSFLKLG